MVVPGKYPPGVGADHPNRDPREEVPCDESVGVPSDRAAAGNRQETLVEREVRDVRRADAIAAQRVGFRRGGACRATARSPLLARELDSAPGTIQPGTTQAGGYNAATGALNASRCELLRQRPRRVVQLSVKADLVCNKGPWKNTEDLEIAVAECID